MMMLNSMIHDGMPSEFEKPLGSERFIALALFGKYFMTLLLLDL